MFACFRTDTFTIRYRFETFTIIEERAPHTKNKNHTYVTLLNAHHSAPARTDAQHAMDMHAIYGISVG